MREAGGTTRVLFIAGWGRCGSTLLDMTLGQLPGVVSAGEVRELWLRGCRENRPCSCNQPFHDCPFWTEVGRRAFGGWDRLDLESVLHVRYSYDRPWGAPLLLSRVRSRQLRAYTDALGRLLGSVAAVADAEVVVDSSKLPTHGLMLRRAPGLDVRTLHLVRDSRGVAYSTQKRVEKVTTGGGSTTLPQYGAGASAARYLAYNGGADALRLLDGPFAQVRYEDLIDEPRAVLRRILALAGLDEDVPLPLTDEDRAVTLQTHHLVDGNPVRFARGPLPLRRDEAWRNSLPERDRRVVSTLTAPLLRRYHYPIGGG